jgi:hypothetical protein
VGRDTNSEVSPFRSVIVIASIAGAVPVRPL